MALKASNYYQKSVEIGNLKSTSSSSQSFNNSHNGKALLTLTNSAMSTKSQSQKT